MSHDSDSESSSNEEIDFDYKKNVDKGTMGLLRDENREDFGHSLLNDNEELSSEDEESDDSKEEIEDSKPLPTIYARMKDPNSDFRFDSEDEEDEQPEDDGKSEYLVFQDETANIVVTDQNPYSLITPAIVTEEIDASLYFPADDDFGKDFEFPPLGIAKDTKPFLSHDVPLPEEHVDNIKNIMKNITLANVPRWAKFEQ